MDPLKLKPKRLAMMMCKLTARQKQVVAMLARGMSDKEASQLLSITTGRYRQNIYNACQRLGVDNRIQLIVIYAAIKTIERMKTS
jgi:DNA-binding CsgD family transcriptional regulator